LEINNERNTLNIVRSKGGERMKKRNKKIRTNGRKKGR
jgi:hypothetical protein